VLAQNARSLWRTTADLLRGGPIIQGNDLEEVWTLKAVKLRDPARGIPAKIWYHKVKITLVGEKI